MNVKVLGRTLDCPFFSEEELDDIERTQENYPSAVCDRFDHILNIEEGSRELFNFQSWWHSSVRCAPTVTFVNYIEAENHLINGLMDIIGIPCEVRLWDDCKNPYLALTYSTSELIELKAYAWKVVTIDSPSFAERLLRSGLRELIQIWFYNEELGVSIVTGHDLSVIFYFKDARNRLRLEERLRRIGLYLK